MGPVTAVTFAGAGPQTGRRGPREPQAAIVLSPRKPASLCQTCFSVCFLFYVFNVGKGECFPSHLLPSLPTVLRYFPPIPVFLPPPTDPSTFVSPLFSSLVVLLHSIPPLFCLPPFFSPWRSSFVKLFARTAHIFVVVLRPPSHSAPFYLYFMRFWPKPALLLSCADKKKKKKKITMRTTLKQQQQKNLSPKEFCLSHAKPIFITRLNKLPITK